MSNCLRLRQMTVWDGDLAQFFYFAEKEVKKWNLG